MGAHVESAEAGVGHEASQLVGFVEREDDLHERGDVGGEVRRQGVLEDGEDLGCGPWDEHQRSARRREDPAHLAQRPRRSGKNCSPSWHSTRSKAPSGNGSASAAASCQEIGTPLAGVDRATASTRG